MRAVCEAREAHRLLAWRGVVLTQEPTPAPRYPGETIALYLDSEGSVVMLGERATS